ncbi:snRNA-activating protein complex subunit 1-like [Archocentrus centrarchus]|uniref:snRNA-activating protein complex subunit 1-like n=1 Tax=Archocentrus centrarchus TaxID=63155 RepID=UPI0011E9F3D8|nr:snRNA-activating protein complex subunit 1-like [Archocentrus centrarchus]
MPRPPCIYSDFFYGPLTEDVEQLLARFQQMDSVRYEDFSAIWREMGFSDVFCGTISTGETKRFCRVALATAVKYFMPPYSYQIRVGGLYLMFGFYHTQLAEPPVMIRLALKDWTHVQTFLKESVDSGHLDVVYIYKKLVATKAIHYTAMPHFLTFQKQQKRKQDPVCADFLSRTTAVHELITADTLEEIANLQSLYENLKEITEEVGSQVAVTHRDLTSRLRDCMSEFITWQKKSFTSQLNKGKKDRDEEDEEEEDEKESCSNRARLLSSIKQKSYGNFQKAPKSRRHRQGEAPDSSRSGAEQVKPAPQKKRPPSLRARTWKNLGVTQKDSNLPPWLLSAPELEDGVPVRRTNQAVTYRM